MACPNKKEDLKIMQTISERNAIKERKTPYEITEIAWHGSLLDIQLMPINLNDVLHLTKLSDQEYVATVILNIE